MDRKTYEIVDKPREKHPVNTELINATGNEMINVDGAAARADESGSSEVSRNQVYKESGSKLPYKDWIQSALQSGELDSLKQKIADKIKNRKKKGDSTDTAPPPPPDKGGDKPTYFLGMRPFVAVMVGVTALSLIAFGAYKFINRKK
jgi:hypothetical protein